MGTYRNLRSRSCAHRIEVMMPLYNAYKNGRSVESFDEWERIQLLQLLLASKSRDRLSSYISNMFGGWKPRVSFKNDEASMKVRWSITGGVSEFEFANVDLLHIGAAVATRWCSLLPLYNAVERLGDMPPIDLHLGDHGESSGGLAFCENRPGFLLIPDCEFIAHRGYAERRPFLREALASRPWHERADRCYWRGAPNGEYRNDPMTLPRIAMCARVKNNVSFDAKVICYSEGSEEEQRLQAASVWGSRDEWQRIIDFRYNIDIDGVTSAWSGFFNKLLSGSCVLKINSPSGFKQWYYDRIKPWEHYVPIATDFCDLEETVNMLLANPNIGEKIGENGRVLVERLTFEGELQKAAESIFSYAYGSCNAPAVFRSSNYRCTYRRPASTRDCLASCR